MCRKLGGLKLSKSAMVLILGIAAVCLGLGLSAFASSLPDGLEWAILNTTGSTELAAPSHEIFATAESVQTQTSIFPDYNHTALPGGTFVAAAVGLLVTCAFAFGLGRLFSKKQPKSM